MFTYLNSSQDRMFFNVELRKIALYPLKNHPKLHAVMLFLGQPNKPSHEVKLGLYHVNSELLKGLATIDEWAKGSDYITLGKIRERLKTSYSSVSLSVVEEVKEWTDDDDDLTK